MTSDEILTIETDTRIFCIGHKHHSSNEYYFPPSVGIIRETHPLFIGGSPERHTAYVVNWLNDVRQTSGEDNISFLGDEIILIKDDKHLLTLQIQYQ